MAIDTVRLRSPFISEEIAQLIENESFQRIGIDLKTMDVAYSLTNGELKGSYDSRIMIMVKRKEYISQTLKGVNAVVNKAKIKTVLIECEPYLEIEASVHKLFLGHNIYGGCDDFQASCQYLIYTIEKILQVKLPRFYNWLVKRIDFSYVFDLKIAKAVNEFFYLMKNSYYARRSVSTFGLHGISFNGSSSLVKMYYKGDEFKNHDFMRLKQANTFTEPELFEMLKKANTILRVEVELKSRKLKYDFEKGQFNNDGKLVHRYGHEPSVKDISHNYLHNAYEVEVNRVMREGKKTSDMTRDAIDVERKLYNLYSDNLANTLFSAFLQIQKFGVERYKDKVAKPTFYRHLKQLRESGISINLNPELNTLEITDHEETLLPKGFQPLRDDIRRLTATDSKMVQASLRLQRELAEEVKIIGIDDYKKSNYIYNKKDSLGKVSQ